jgi:hypothetical protein
MSGNSLMAAKALSYWKTLTNCRILNVELKGSLKGGLFFIWLKTMQPLE